MSLNTLFAILSEEEALLELMKECAQRKKEALVSNKPELLEGIGSEDIENSKKWFLIERKLLAWQQEHCPGQRLREYEKKLDTAAQEQLRAARKRIVEAAEAVKHLNECNELLLKYSLDYIDFVFKTLSGHSNSGKIYTQNKSLHIGGQLNLCNIRA